jgi:hypothetical protein
MKTNSSIASPARAMFTHSDEFRRKFDCISWSTSDCDAWSSVVAVVLAAVIHSI